MARKADAQAHFRPEIEGLRAVAIIAVLLFHVGVPGFGGGFVGVDVFFVISGFLITGLLLRERRRSGRIDLTGFYSRRFKRLLPAAAVVIVATLIASWFILSPLRFPGVAIDGAASAMYVANYRFAASAVDYLAIADPSPFLHFWSLAIEEQFYLLWPALLMVVAFVTRGSERAAAIVVAAIVLISIALSVTWTETSEAWAFYSLPTRAWQLAIGALVAIGVARGLGRAGRFGDAVAAAGVGLIVVAVLGYSESVSYPGLAALVPVVGTALVIVGTTGSPGHVARVLSMSGPRWLGRISYSLYLWHWPLLILVPIAVGDDSLGLRVLLGVVAIGLAALSTRYVEEPIRDGVVLRLPKLRYVTIGLATSMSIAVAAVAVAAYAPSFDDERLAALRRARDDLPRSYADGCHVDQVSVEPIECTYGQVDGVRTAMLIGDSHAAQWLPALDILSRDAGVRLVAHTKSACTPVALTVWHPAFGRGYHECDRWRENVLDRLAVVQPDVVFIGSSNKYVGLDPDAREAMPIDRQLWGERLGATLASLGQSAGTVVLLAETPAISFDPLDCLVTQPHDGDCTVPRATSIDGDYERLERRVAERVGATVLSANELLCADDPCRLIDAGVIIYRDAGHVTATYMASLAPRLPPLLDGR